MSLGRPEVESGASRAPVVTRAAPRREKGDALTIKEPEPARDRWRTSGRRPRRWRRSEFSSSCWELASISAARLLLPVLAALVVGTTLAPIVKAAPAIGISPWVTAIALGAGADRRRRGRRDVARQPGQPNGSRKAPEIGATIKQKLYVLDRPLAALRELQEVLLPLGRPTRRGRIRRNWRWSRRCWLSSRRR